MAKEITPALTPEEWGQKWFRCGDMDIQVHSDSIDLTWGVSRYDSVRIGEATPAEQLKLAARILHGHPQGFTCADVRMARRLASYRQISMRERMMQAQYGGDAEAVNRARNEAMGGDQGGFSLSPKYREWLESLAARIEALLPPEGA